jgi:putative ABC transport system permease protein
MFIKIIYESIVQAMQQLYSNKLRSFLSLLGISIGIFCIIAVKSAVDSLKQNIEVSFEKLGNDVLYIDKMPWNEPPHTSWWKYAKRPEPDFADYQALKKRVKGSDLSSISVFIPSRTIKYHSSHVEGAYMAGVTNDFSDIFNIEFEKGRYFTPFEYESGANRVILGKEVAAELFRTVEPIGKEVRIRGQKFQVIGVMQKEGESLFSPFNFDEAVITSYNAIKKLINVKSRNTYGTSLNIKAAAGVSLEDLKDEVTGVLRAHRKLRPREDENFAINELSMFTNMIQPIFKVLNIAGLIIGGFALIVGMISVANIMFVSVKERTNIIGVKKALGARKSVILLEFLIESIILCVIGGLIGLLIVLGSLRFISSAFHYDMFLSMDNVVIAVVVAVIVGIISGAIPAIQAAKMDPVDAIRS